VLSGAFSIGVGEKFDPTTIRERRSKCPARSFVKQAWARRWSDRMLSLADAVSFLDPMLFSLLFAEDATQLVQWRGYS
jgi:hypothetical protein